MNDGTTPANNASVVPTGAIAVVFSAGAVLTRLDASTPQDRSCAGDSNMASCQSTRVCTGPVFTATARCNPSNYLDVVNSTILATLAGAEDNGDFADSSNVNGFIAGPIEDASHNVVVNDQLILVRYADLIPRLEQRAAREAFNCLQVYAGGVNYPWAVPVNADYTVPPSTSPTTAGLVGVKDTYFGRLPQQLSSGSTFSRAVPGESRAGLGQVVGQLEQLGVLCDGIRVRTSRWQRAGKLLPDRHSTFGLAGLEAGRIRGGSARP